MDRLKNYLCLKIYKQNDSFFIDCVEIGCSDKLKLHFNPLADKLKKRKNPQKFREKIL